MKGVTNMETILHNLNFSNTIMDTLNIEITKYTPQEVKAAMPVTSKTHQPFGKMHGGASLVLAETVASAGSYLFIDKTCQHAVGLEINANHLRSQKDGIVEAVGIPLHVGKRTLVWDVRIYNEENKLICISRCTIAVIDKNE